VAFETFTEEGLGGGDVAGTAEVGFDGLAVFIHGAVQVNPIARAP